MQENSQGCTSADPQFDLGFPWKKKRYDKSTQLINCSQAQKAWTI
jgi:hypothetical protein